MNINPINIKRILLGILAIAITITVGISIAKAEAAPSRLDLDRGDDLSLRVARRSRDLRADLSARLTRDELLDSTALGRLDSALGRLVALDTLDSARLDTLDTLDGRLLG